MPANLFVEPRSETINQVKLFTVNLVPQPCAEHGGTTTKGVHESHGLYNKSNAGAQGTSRVDSSRLRTFFWSKYLSSVCTMCLTSVYSSLTKGGAQQNRTRKRTANPQAQRKHDEQKHDAQRKPTQNKANKTRQVQAQALRTSA